MTCYDALIIGGGPGGATAGLLLARAGLRALIVEKSTFPRFRIGESLLPRNGSLLRELGLDGQVESLPHVRKLGVEFSMGHETQSVCFPFDQGLLPGAPTYNVGRASFDAMLLEQARAAGAEVREGVGVRSILRLGDGDVAVATDAGEFRARYLLDASGQSTVVARHLGTRRGYEDPIFQKIAYFAHFENVKRRAGEEAGHPYIAMCEEGWFWIIPIDDRRTSVGLVMDANLARQTNVPANRMLAWGVERCPAIQARMSDAAGPQTNQVVADFSYTCRPYAGPGYVLIGDAAAFLDPIFSTGVCLSMMSAREAASHVITLLRNGSSPERARRQYIRFIDRSTRPYFKLIRQYYRHSFRELFLNGTGPFQVHRAVLSVLAGHVFPSVPMTLRWRMRLFEFFLWLHERKPIVPVRERWSLLKYDGSLSSGPVGSASADADRRVTMNSSAEADPMSPVQGRGGQERQGR